jgi:signal transduction histidine kinase
MKKALVALALVLPAIILGLAYLFPQADPFLPAPLFHFYIVSFTTFAATVVSLFVTISVGQVALPRHLLLAVAYAWMGAIFFIHGVTTPGAVITHFHPAITWSAWLTLFGGGVLFLVSSFAPPEPNPRLLRGIALTILVIYLIYVWVVIFDPDLLTALLTQPPPNAEVIAFGLTLAVWLGSTIKHYAQYRQTHNFLDGLIAFEAGWFATATVSMFRFPLWKVSWWLYHVILLAGFLIAIVALWRAYEQVRTFRLVRYYAAGSLIVTAALALFSAQIYSQLVYQNLLAQLKNNTQAISLNLASEVAASLPSLTTTDDLNQVRETGEARRRLRERLPDLQIQAVNLYNVEGAIVFSSEEEFVGLHLKPDSEAREELEEALDGKTSFDLHEPGSPPAAYTPTADVYILDTYVPFQPAGASAPIGMVETFREAPELAEAITLSRRSGLGLAALSLGGLFLALLVIVRRADQLITHRTLELERAYANLREAEGLRDDLTNMIVHDLRNPLTAITANLDLIGKTMNDPAYADAPPRFLSSARGAGQRMMGLIDDLLNFSKLEAGELRPVLAPVYLPTLLNEKEEGFRPQAEKETKTFSVKAPAQLPTLPADAGLISRVIDNLISNAFKYTDSGGHIEVEAEQHDQTLLIHVRDDGQGIPLEYHTRIFDKFVQVADASGAPLRKGTGLGLAFCRLAVEAHGGKIWVESTPGSGSNFSFTLPLNQQQE